MAFLDYLQESHSRLFFGGERFEEDLVYQGSTEFKGVVDIESFDTGAGAENEVNRSIVKLATIYAPATAFTTTPTLYEEITQPRESITWTIKQMKREHGMWTFTVTSGDNYRRGRIR